MGMVTLMLTPKTHSSHPTRLPGWRATMSVPMMVEVSEIAEANSAPSVAPGSNAGARAITTQQAATSAADSGGSDQTRRPGRPASGGTCTATPPADSRSPFSASLVTCQCGRSPFRDR
jgi:hypothetical protein